MPHMTPRSYTARILSVVLLGSAFALGGCSNSIQKLAPSQQEQAIADKACQLTTQILQRREGDYHECMKVELDRQVTDTFYQAHAILENGDDQQMGIRLSDKNSEEITVVLKRTGW